jgi:hypothetical protein
LGSNTGGELGLGTTDNQDHPIPTKVPNIAGVVELDTNHSGFSQSGKPMICARTSTGIDCWGGYTTPAILSVPLPGEGVIDIDVASDDVLMRGVSGTVHKATRQNATTFSTVSVASAIPVTHMDEGCFVRSNGTLSCNSNFAAGTVAQVGGHVHAYVYNTQSSSYPHHQCVLTTGGLVRCWGKNNVGQAAARPPFYSSPTLVPGVSNAQHLCVGGDATGAITPPGDLLVWGDDTSVAMKALLAPTLVGALGQGNEHFEFTRWRTSWGGNPGAPGYAKNQSGTWQALQYGSLVPNGGVLVNPEKDYTQLVSLSSYTFGRLPDGRILARNHHASPNVIYPLLGNGAPYVVDTAVDVVASSGSAGFTFDHHGCMWFSDGSAKCWGFNSSGELGDTTTTTPNTPVSVALPSGLKVSNMRTGKGFTCSVMQNGSVYCWGKQALSSSVYTAVPGPISTVTGAVDLTCGYDAGETFCCAWSPTKAWCWGKLVTHDSSPWEMTGVTSVDKLVAGSSFACSLSTTGAVHCWGGNSLGQVGVGSSQSEFDMPQLVLADSVSELVAGTKHACALLNTGGVLCWGDHTYGQVGSGEELAIIGADNAQTIPGLD